MFACSSQPLESTYPDYVISKADAVRLVEGDVSIDHEFTTFGIAAGQSCESEELARKMLRLEAAKKGADSVYRYTCWKSVGNLMTCPVEYRCKGKAVGRTEAKDLRDRYQPET